MLLETDSRFLAISRQKICQYARQLHLSVFLLLVNRVIANELRVVLCKHSISK